jgi:hypothetical protein
MYDEKRAAIRRTIRMNNDHEAEISSSAASLWAVD